MVETNLVTKEYLNEQFANFGKIIDQKFEDFAILMANGFKEVRGEIYDLEVKMNDRFDQVDKRFEKMEAHFGRMEV